MQNGVIGKRIGEPGVLLLELLDLELVGQRLALALSRTLRVQAVERDPLGLRLRQLIGRLFGRDAGIDDRQRRGVPLAR